MGEHLPCKQGVESSNLLVSTMIIMRAAESGSDVSTSELAQASGNIDPTQDIRRISVTKKMRSIFESGCSNKKNIIITHRTLKTEYRKRS